MSIELKMGWRNIWRNPRRSVLTICAIAFASLLLVFMLSFQFGSYSTMINASVKIHTGHLQIQAEGYHEKQDIRRVVSDPSAVIARLKSIPGVSAVTSRAEAFALVSAGDRTYGVLVTGIDPTPEARVSRLKTLIRKGEYLAESDDHDALIGQLLARNLHVGLGDELTVIGQGRDGSIAATVLRIKGIYKSGIDQFDRSAVHMPLTTFQRVFSMRSAVHQIVVIASSLSEVSAVKHAALRVLAPVENANHPLAVLDWDELMPGLRQSIELDLISGGIFYLILILVVAFSILNTFLMAIFERTREFGVLMAIGTSPGRLTRLLLIESLSLTALGIFSGIVAGVSITYYFQTHGIDISGTEDLLSQFGITGRIFPQLSILSVSIGPLAVLVITFLAALFPALKVKRLQPVEAMTSL